MLEHVWQATRAAGGFERVLIATDDARVADTARGFGADVVRTGPADSGTERASRVVPREVATVVVQADQPALDPGHLVALRSTIARAPVGTLVTPTATGGDDPACVKARVRDGLAIDFSRQRWPDLPILRHVGLYAFAPGWLPRCGAWRRSTRAREHDLEQLTWLDRGVAMAVTEVDRAGLSVDTWPQLVQARALLARSS